jgi:hypothetical protein
MSWQRRLQEMVMAGGTLTAIGCNGRTVPTPPANADGGELDATAEASVIDARTIDVPPIGTTICDGSEPDAFIECCNANPDPCCTYEYCCAPLLEACACQLKGGTWSSGNPTAGSCVLGAAGED